MRTVRFKITLKDGVEKEILSSSTEHNMPNSSFFSVGSDHIMRELLGHAKEDVKGLTVIEGGVHIISVIGLTDLEWVKFEDGTDFLHNFKTTNDFNDTKCVKKIMNVPTNINGVVCDRTATITNLGELLDNNVWVRML